MTWIIGGISLSYGPSRVRLPKSTKKETVENDGDYPTNVNTGMQFEAQLEGTLPVADAANISGLLALVGTEVSVSGSVGGLLDGSWNLDSFEPTKNGPGPVYDYTIRLTKGKENITFG
jgi:hypothetical protein